MTIRLASISATGMSGAVVLTSLVGCAGLGSGERPAAMTGFGTVGSSSSSRVNSSPFLAPGKANDQGVAKPDSALLVYIPPTQAEEVKISPAGGYPINITYNDPNNRQSATIAFRASLTDSKGIDAGVMEQPLRLLSRSGGSEYYDNTSTSYLLANRGNSTYNLVLDNSTYGWVWFGDAAGNRAIAPYHTGTPTSQAQLPTAVTATYTGVFEGIEYRSNSASNYYTAPMQMNANFGAGTVSGAVARPTGSQMGIVFDGTITGNAYQGTAIMVGAPAANLVTTKSAVNGAFYGPNAVETAGAIAVQGRQDLPGAPNSPVTVVGAFGAKR